ncbi:glycosyltransferase family 2 protein [Patescibacteria group bacterium]|nr:glycosyltransferase family 2 protein [Patescibacteria group bacterium]
MVDLSIILPIHNEEDIIEKVVDEVLNTLKKIKIFCEILLVENGSTDKSLSVVRKIASKNKNVKVLVTKKGYGNAVIKGLIQARGKYVCYMPSDGQVDLNLLKTLWDSINSGDYDLVKVKRITRENIIRYLTSWCFNHTISLIFHTKFIDVNGSPKIFLQKHVKKLNLQSKDSFIDTEFIIKIFSLRWKIKEFSMRNIERYGGKTTRSYKTYLEFFGNIINYKFSPQYKAWLKSV